MFPRNSDIPHTFVQNLVIFSSQKNNIKITLLFSEKILYYSETLTRW